MDANPGGYAGRALALLISSLLLASCGGSDEGGDGDNGGSNDPGLSVSTNALEVNADAGLPSFPTGSFTITITDAPREGVSIGGRFTDNGITDISLEQTSDSTGTVTVFFRDPSVVGAGVYEDELELGICTDDSCEALIAGTRHSIAVTYTVTGTPPQQPTITASTHAVMVQEAPFVLASPSEIVTLTLDGVTSSNVQINIDHTNNGISYAFTQATNDSTLELNVSFKASATLGVGTYVDTLTVTACRFGSCPLNLDGSPLVITTTYEVSETVSGENGYTIRQVDVSAVDLVWDEVHGKIYLSSPSSAPENADSIVVLDPVTGEVGDSVFAGSEPSYSAVTDGGEYLYVGLDGSNSIQRFTLPDLAQDISIPMGSYPQGPLFAGEIQALPGEPGSIALIRSATQRSNMTANYDLSIFDGAVQRPDTVNFVGQFAAASLQFGATPDVIYAGDGVILTLRVGADGVSLDSTADFDTGSSPARIRYDDGILYTDRGQAIDPVASTLLGSYPMEPGEFGMAVVPASDLNRVFFLVTDGFKRSIRAYDLATFTAIADVPLEGVEFPINTQLRMIRWGEGGLALPTGDGRVLLVTGPFVKTVP